MAITVDAFGGDAGFCSSLTTLNTAAWIASWCLEQRHPALQRRETQATFGALSTDHMNGAGLLQIHLAPIEPHISDVQSLALYPYTTNIWSPLLRSYPELRLDVSEDTSLRQRDLHQLLELICERFFSALAKTGNTTN